MTIYFVVLDVSSDADLIGIRRLNKKLARNYYLLDNL